MTWTEELASVRERGQGEPQQGRLAAAAAAACGKRARFACRMSMLRFCASFTISFVSCGSGRVRRRRRGGKRCKTASTSQIRAPS